MLQTRLQSGEGLQGGRFSLAEAGKLPEETCLVFSYSLPQEDDGWQQLTLSGAEALCTPTILLRPINGTMVSPITLARHQGVNLNFFPLPRFLRLFGYYLLSGLPHTSQPYPCPSLLSMAAPLQALGGLGLGLLLASPSHSVQILLMV